MNRSREVQKLKVVGLSLRPAQQELDKEQIEERVTATVQGRRRESSGRTY